MSLPFEHVPRVGPLEVRLLLDIVLAFIGREALDLVVAELSLQKQARGLGPIIRDQDTYVDLFEELAAELGFDGLNFGTGF